MSEIDQIISEVSELLDQGIPKDQEENNQEELERLQELQRQIFIEENYGGYLITILIFLWYIRKTYTEIVCVFDFKCVYNPFHDTFYFQHFNTEIPGINIIIQQIHNCSKKYAIIPVFIIGETYGHLTMILINYQLGTMEYYDSHGYQQKDMNLLLHLEKYLTSIALVLNLTLKFSALNCPTQYIGMLQYYSGSDNLRDIGYCVIHSFVFILLRLEYDELTIDELVVKITEKMHQIKVNTLMNNIAGIITQKAIDIAYKFGIIDTQIKNIDEKIINFFGIDYLLNQMYTDQHSFSLSPSDIQSFIPEL